MGGGAKIVDKFNGTGEMPDSAAKLGQRHSAGVQTELYLELRCFLSGQWGPLYHSRFNNKGENR